LLLQLRGYNFRNIVIESRQATEEDEERSNLGLNYSYSEVQDKTLRIVLKAKLAGVSNMLLVEAKVELIGIFELPENMEDLELKAREHFVFNALLILYGTLRGYFSLFTSLATDGPGIVIPSFNMAAFVRDHEKRMREREESTG